jgi:hypothetical protein
MHPPRLTNTGATVLGTVLLALLACHDLTAPLRERLLSAKSATPLNPPGMVVVSPDSMRGWAFYDDQHGVACSDISKCQMAIGPTAPPAGSGSAELATATAGDGNALILADYAGVRFDNITALSYSTFRQSDDAGNNLAIALQFNVDYDLNDQSTNYQGRLVFEPYRGNGGNVVAGAWQSWDARSGRWWGTKSTVTRNGALVPNPCVQSSPCSWAQVLSIFPNAGIHVTYGAVILKAGSGWPSFRGNVDRLVIAINGASTTFDFERSAGTASFRLHSEIESGLTVPPASADSDYAPGAIAHYDFAATSGHDAPVVILDDSLVSPSGDIQMDRPHLLRAAADSTVDQTTLTPLGQAIATRLSAILTASDKVEAYRELIEFTTGSLVGGTTATELVAAADRAAYVTYDLDRDAAALDAVDAALSGYNFDIYDDASGSAPYIYAYSTREAIGETNASVSASTSLRSMRASRSLSAQPALGQPGRATGAGTMQTSIPGATHAAIAVDPESPQEQTQVLYLNGIATTHDEAAVSSGLLSSLVKSRQRFANNRTYVTFKYVRNHAQEMKDYDAAHPCLRPAQRDLRWRTFAGTFFRYRQCMKLRADAWLKSLDFVEAINEHASLELNLRPNDADADSLARMISAARKPYSNAHVIIVSHSQGNMIAAQAVQELPSLDGHPVQQATRCVASLALASPIVRDYMALDSEHKDGFVIEGDIILQLKPFGYDILPTAKSATLAAAIAQTRDPVLKTALILGAGLELHRIDNTYLALPEARAAILGRLTELHRECVPGRLVVNPDSLRISAGAIDFLDAHLYNQHDRPLQRSMGYTVVDPYWFGVDTLGAVSAHVPTDTLEKTVWVQPEMTWLWVQIPVRIPTTQMTGITTKADTSWWEGVAASNGPDGAPIPIPPTPHYGASCNQEITLTGPTESWGRYVQMCRRTFFFTPERLTDNVIAPLVSAYTVTVSRNGTMLLADGKLATDPDPLTFMLVCGYGDCFDQVVFGAVERHGVTVARSGPIQWQGGSDSRIGTVPIVPLVYAPSSKPTPGTKLSSTLKPK